MRHTSGTCTIPTLRTPIVVVFIPPVVVVFIPGFVIAAITRFVFASIMFVVFASIVLVTASTAGAQVREVSIGMVLDGPGDRNAALIKLFDQEITDLLRGEFEARFLPDRVVVADWTQAGIEASLDRLLADPEVDLILALGFQASITAARRESLTKPVIAPFVIQLLLEDLPQERGGSGVRNLTYLAIPNHFERDIKAFREIVPFSRLAILYHEPIIEAYANARDRVATELLRIAGQQASAVPVFDSAEKALALIPPDVDAVYVLGVPALSAGEKRHLARGLIERKLPSFSMAGRSDVEQGFLAGLLSGGVFDQRARRTALIVQRILLGEAPESIPVAIATEQRLSLNMATARAIGVSPRWVILTEADLVDEVRRGIERRLTLEGVIREAVLVNLDLEAQRYALRAGKQEVNEARAQLLPQIGVEATGAIIDEDRAAAGMGQMPERTVIGGANFTQIIFAEPAWANLCVQGHLQRGREQELETLRLDIAHDAAAVYLDVLAARALELIEKDNLRITRENLALAKVRETVGVARPAEVYRWEAQIAANRRRVIKANSQRNLVEIQLNRILHHPLEEPFTSEDIVSESAAPDVSELISKNAPPFMYIDTRRNFKLLRKYMLAEACDHSPELKQLDAAIAAQERYLKSQGWQYYAPTIALQAGVENVFGRDGTGSEGTDLSGLPPEYAPLAGLFPETPDDVSWRIGVNVSLPLFKGGSRLASQRMAREELGQLRKQREALAERIAQRLLSALHTAGASYASIRLTREAAEAAAKTLDVVTDAYARGAVSVLDLLDAQNADLYAERAAAIAVYQFLGDYAHVQRAVGQFDVFVGDDARQQRTERIERYILDNGGVIRVR